MPVILATQEAEIRRMEGQGQGRQLFMRPVLKKDPIPERAGRMAQVVECLSSPDFIMLLLAKKKKKKA
jgi:hypothetical protein